MIKFPPINLFSKPIQEEYELMLKEVADLKIDQDYCASKMERWKCFKGQLSSIQKSAERRLEELNFIYYTRTGRFL